MASLYINEYKLKVCVRPSGLPITVFKSHIYNVDRLCFFFYLLIDSFCHVLQILGTQALTENTPISISIKTNLEGNFLQEKITIFPGLYV